MLTLVIFFLVRSVTYLSPTAFPNTTLIIYGTQSPTFAPAVPTIQPSSIPYCICTACCNCSHVIIPTNVLSIANDAFKECGGGTQLLAVIITT